MTDLPIIRAERLVKRFGRAIALDGADLTVERGQVHGFLGPNGAGKSTTIRAILGQISLTSGELEVLGLDPRRDAVAIHRRLAYVPGDVSLWPSLTGGQCLDLLAGFHGREDRARRDRFVEAFDLDLSKRARTYSKGNRQKVALVAALALDVDLYVFDEPTSGLDPLMEVTFQQAVRELADRGATVLLSSHILDEVESLCSHVTILRSGRTISAGSLEDLRRATTTTISATLADEETVRTLIERIDGAEAVADASGIHLTAKVERERVAAAVGAVAAADPLSLVVRPPSLDELFLEHYAGAAADDGAAR